MKRVLNIAHRGFTERFPDNTLEAFEAAIRIPVDGIECDVQETADGQFIMFHDPVLNGRGINDYTLEEIRGLRLAGGFSIPTLTDTLDLCHGRVSLNVELKKVWSVRELLHLVKAWAGAEELLLTSFSRDLVLELAALAPELPRGIITATEVPDYVRLAQETRSDAVIVRFPFASAEVVAEAHAAGLPVFVWGCADIAELRDALGMGIDGIISDWPDQAKEEIERLAGG